MEMDPWWLELNPIGDVLGGSLMGAIDIGHLDLDRVDNNPYHPSFKVHGMLQAIRSRMRYRRRNEPIVVHKSIIDMPFAESSAASRNACPWIWLRGHLQLHVA